MTKIVKQAKADIYLRDTDSQSLFNNSGELSFKYFHEWNDCYNKTTGKTAQIDGETYDESTGTYKPNCPEGYIPVFNGRLSALWDNMVSCFPDRIKSMYVTMRGNGLSYKDMLMKYKEFWRYWCENLYNADAFGYANTGNFDKAFGDKLQMMDFFFQKRQRYLDSKYCCGSSVSNHLRMRLSEVGKGFAIKYYQAIYSSLQWAVGSFATQRNIEPGTYSYMPWKMEGSPQDTTFDIDDADLITELSTYTKTSSGYTITGLEGVGNFKFDSDMGILKRLTKFIMNYTVAKPNTNELGAYFDLSGMTLLKQVIVRNVKNLTKSIVINSDMVEEIDFTNTPIVGITTPPSDSLTKLVLPNTITSLKLKGYTNLPANGLQIAGYSNIDEFEVEDCPNLNSYELLKNCYDAGAPLTNVTLKGINWQVDDAEIVTYLAKKKANIKGKITFSDSVSLRFSQKLEFMKTWGDVDSEDNALHIKYSQKEIFSATIVGDTYAYSIGDKYTYTITPNPVNGNNVASVNWNIESNDFADIDDDGVLSVHAIGSEANDDKATIHATITLTDGSTVSATKEVHFYKRECKLGDYVFSDGTYGNDLKAKPTQKPVAVVFYIDRARSLALAVALKDLNPTNSAWGLSQINHGISGIKLSDNPAMNVYDIDLIPNISNTLSATESNMLDSDGNFKTFDELNNLSDIGFEVITKDIYEKIGLYLKRIGLGIGDYIAKGHLYTLAIVAHRDTILGDSAVNLDIPKALGTNDDWSNLNKAITNIIATNNTNYQQYYYPAASYCYTYSPTSDTNSLDDSVKPMRWFMPSIGEMARILLHSKKGYSYNGDLAIFSKAYQDNVFTALENNENRSYASSTEISENKFLLYVSSSGSCVGGQGSGYVYGKEFASNRFRPVVTIKI